MRATPAEQEEKAIAHLEKVTNPEVAKFVKQYKLPLSPDGKLLRMVKVVKKGKDGEFPSNHKPSFVYKLGMKVVAPDYAPRGSCGQGLHFSPTEQIARGIIGAHGSEYTALVVDVDVESMVGIQYGSQPKVKAKFCHVLHEGNEESFMPRPEPKAHRWG